MGSENAQEPGCQGSWWTKAELFCQPQSRRGRLAGCAPFRGIVSPVRWAPLPTQRPPPGTCCLPSPARCRKVLTGAHWLFVVAWEKKRERERERVMIWGWSWGGGSLGAGWCTTAEEAERGAMVTVDVEAVLVQAVGSQPRDASGLVADFMVEAHPVQGQGGGLLPVGADCVHRRVVPFPHWPGKHSAVPEHPLRLCALSLQGQALGLPQPSLCGNASSACPTRACVVAGHCSPASPDALGRFKEHGARQSI